MSGIEVRLENHIPEVMGQIKDQLKERMQDACMAVRLKAIDLIRTPGKGAIYETYFWTDAQGNVRPGRPRGKPHQASAPGDPPTTDTGELQQSIAFEVSADGREGKVGTNKAHGLYMEFGTHRVAPRPWLRIAFEQSEKEIIDIFTKEMKEGGIQAGFPTPR